MYPSRWLQLEKAVNNNQIYRSDTNLSQTLRKWRRQYYIEDTSWRYHLHNIQKDMSLSKYLQKEKAVNSSLSYKMDMNLFRSLCKLHRQYYTEDRCSKSYLHNIRKDMCLSKYLLKEEVANSSSGYKLSMNPWYHLSRWHKQHHMKHRH